MADARYQVPPGQERERPRVRINAGRVWLTGLMTGIVAAVGNTVVYLFSKEIFDVPLAVTRPGTDVLEELTIPMVLLAGFVPAILATGLLHALLRFVPNPLAFFSLICLGALFISLIAPLTLDVQGSVKVALIVMHLLTGVIILGLLGSSVDRFYDRAVPPTARAGG